MGSSYTSLYTFSIVLYVSPVWQLFQSLRRWCTSTPPRTIPSAPPSTKTQAQTSTASPGTDKLTSSRSGRPHFGTVVILDRLNKARAHRVKERSEWVREAEERRLDKLKAYSATEEIHDPGEKQAALVEKMMQDLFAFTPVWGYRDEE